MQPTRSWWMALVWGVWVVGGVGRADVQEISPIVVTPSAYTLSVQPQFAREVDLAEATNLPLIDNDLLRTVQLYPSVVGSDFTARFQLRGGEKDEVLLRLDGIPLYQPFHLPDFDGALSAIDPALIHRAELYMGGFPARLGGKMSGVFDLRTRSPARSRRTLLGFDLLKLQLLHEGPVGAGGYLFSVRRGYIDWVLELIDKIQPLDEKYRPRYLDVFGKYALPGPGNSAVESGFLFSRDTNLIDRPGGLDDLDSAYDNGVLWGRWDRSLGEQGTVSLRSYYGWASRDRIQGTVERDDRSLRYAGAIAEVSWRPFSGHTLGVGVEPLWSRGTYRYYEVLTPFPELVDDPMTIDLETSLAGWQWSGYVQEEWQVGRHLALLVGTRFLRQAGQSRLWWSPRAGVAVRPTQSLTLRLAAGRFYQPISPLTLPVESNVAQIRDPERADHWIAGIEWTPRSAFSVRLEAYRKRYRSLTGRSRDVGREVQFARFPTEGRAWGLELFAQHQATAHLTWLGGYAFSSAEVTEGDQTYPRDFDQRHSLLLSLLYRLSDQTSLALTWRAHSGNPVTPVRFERDASGRPIPRVGPPNAERLPAFHSLDLRVTRVFHPRWGEITAYFQVINLYNRQNVHEYSYDPEQNYARVAEPLLPITPTFGVTAEF